MVGWIISQQTNVKAPLRGGIQVELVIVERQASCDRRCDYYSVTGIAILVNNVFTAALFRSLSIGYASEPESRSPVYFNRSTICCNARRPLPSE